jgi:hypothetical protein
MIKKWFNKKRRGSGPEGRGFLIPRFPEKKLNLFFRNLETVYLRNMNRITVYVPLIVYGRDRHEYHATSCGCFVNKNDVYEAILRKLVKINFIPFNDFVKWLKSIKNKEKDEEEEDEDEDEDILDEDLINLDEKTLTVEQFIEYLLKKVDNNYDNLLDICDKYGDSYHKDGWKVQINEHILHT